MREKISIIIIMLMLIVANIYIFFIVKDKKTMIKNINLEDEDKLVNIEIPNKEPKIKESKKLKEKINIKNSKDLAENINNFEVVTVGYNKELEDFIKEYLHAVYDYDTLLQDNNLEKYYSKEKLKIFQKYTEKDSKYDEKSKLAKYNCFIYTIDEKNYIVESIISREATQIAYNEVKTPIDTGTLYKHTFRVIKANNGFKIDSEEIRTIDNLMQ